MFFFLLDSFEEDSIANCSQIIWRHDVKIPSLFMSLAQTATCQRAEHEKWRDNVYPASDTSIFLALSGQKRQN